MKYKFFVQFYMADYNYSHRLRQQCPFDIETGAAAVAMVNHLTPT